MSGILNYQHLLYFWTVAHEGSIVAASKRLHVTPSTISVQLRALEDRFDCRLFDRVGRGLKLTEVGHTAYRYADEIFSTGRELEGFLSDRRPGHVLRLEVGVARFLPTSVAWTLLRSAFTGTELMRVVCRTADSATLVGQLLLHQLDVILSDVPLAPEPSVNLYNRFLGESGVSFFGEPTMAEQCRSDFPRCLERTGVLVPTTGTEMRRNLDAWFARMAIDPMITGEFDDLALMKTAGASGLGLFPVPDFVADVAAAHYGVRAVGRAEGVRERLFAVSAERRINHPGVAAIVEHAAQFFAEAAAPDRLQGRE